MRRAQAEMCELRQHVERNDLPLGHIRSRSICTPRSIRLARVRSAGRRGPIPQPVFLETAGLTINLGVREVRRGKGHDRRRLTSLAPRLATFLNQIGA